MSAVIAFFKIVFFGVVGLALAVAFINLILIPPVLLFVLLIDFLKCEPSLAVFISLSFGGLWAILLPEILD